MQKTNQFLCNFNEARLQISIIAAKELTEELKMKPEKMIIPRSADVRRRLKKMQFSYEAPDEPNDNLKSRGQLLDKLF